MWKPIYTKSPEATDYKRYSVVWENVRIELTATTADDAVNQAKLSAAEIDIQLVGLPSIWAALPFDGNMNIEIVPDWDYYRKLT